MARLDFQRLIYGYSPETSKNHKKQRALHADELPRGNKSEQLAILRAKQKLQEKEAIAQTHLDFSCGDNDRTEIEVGESPLK